jgi:hypothetical protein
MDTMFCDTTPDFPLPVDDTTFSRKNSLELSGKELAYKVVESVLRTPTPTPILTPTSPVMLHPLTLKTGQIFNVLLYF